MDDEERVPPLQDLPPADDGVPSPPAQPVAEFSPSARVSAEQQPGVLGVRGERYAAAHQAVGTPASALGSGPLHAVRWLNYALRVLEVLLAIRLVLLLFAANPQAIFSVLIYSVTGPFVAPFYGVFPSAVGGGHQFDAATVLAMLIYPLLDWAIVRLLQMQRKRGTTPV
jgi:hypothetical protein